MICVGGQYYIVNQISSPPPPSLTYLVFKCLVFQRFKRFIPCPVS